jgi:hypothetical protein
MNDRIPLKSRLLAAVIHLTGTIISSIIVVSVPVFALGSNFLSEPVFWTVIWGTFMLASCLLWIFTSRMDDFIDCARRDVSNTLINSFLGTTICITSVVFVFWTTCGMGSEDTNHYLCCCQWVFPAFSDCCHICTEGVSLCESIDLSFLPRGIAALI